MKHFVPMSFFPNTKTKARRNMSKNNSENILSCLVSFSIFRFEQLIPILLKLEAEQQYLCCALNNYFVNVLIRFWLSETVNSDRKSIANVSVCIAIILHNSVSLVSLVLP